MAGFNLDDYVDVAERIAIFREKHPEGSLQAEVIQWPSEFIPFVTVRAYAYRSPDDPRPGTGLAWENFPGTTPYTRNSELQNAESSAWGRAIVAALAADTKKGVASKQEVQRVQGDRARRSAPEQPGGAGTASPGVIVSDSDSGPATESAPSPIRTRAGGESGGRGDAPRSDRCAHKWKDAPRAGFEVCGTCGEARRKEKAVL